MEKNENSSVSEKVAGKIASAKTILISVLVAAVVVITVFVLCSVINTKVSKKGLTAIDSISYNLTKDSVSLSAEDLDARRAKAMTDLTPYTKKGGVVGVRANMLAGEISYSQKNYESCVSYWETAAKKDKNVYTAPLCYYNAAVAYEELGNLDKAESCYEKAIGYKEFVQIAHAKFSLGRVKEAKGDVEGAIKAYKDLTDTVSNDSFVNLAKSRLLLLDNSSN